MVVSIFMPTAAITHGLPLPLVMQLWYSVTKPLCVAAHWFKVETFDLNELGQIPMTFALGLW